MNEKQHHDEHHQNQYDKVSIRDLNKEYKQYALSKKD